LTAVTKFTGIKTISFDVDGTLWDFDAVMKYSLGETLKELSRIDPGSASLLSVAHMIEVRELVHTSLLPKTISLNEIRLESIKQALRDIGRSDDALGLHLFGIYVQHRDSNMALFDDVLPVFEHLSRKRKYRLGLLSNGNCYADRLGLQDFVSFQVFSQDHCGVEKPDPRLFTVALQESKCRPKEFLHVGDSLKYDVAGAHSAGVHVVWLNRMGEKAMVPHRNTEISSLHQLAELVE
jgi:putative hydrolase of the HAD superfamily